ncbi:hypothetical protein [Bradyrhizobium embrapense]
MKLLDLHVSLQQRHRPCLDLPANALRWDFSRSSSSGNGSSGRTSSVALITQDARSTACVMIRLGISL